MEATLDRLPNQHSSAEITTTDSGNVVSSYEEGKGSSRNGSGYTVSEKSGGKIISENSKCLRIKIGRSYVHIKILIWPGFRFYVLYIFEVMCI